MAAKKTLAEVNGRKKRKRTTHKRKVGGVRRRRRSVRGAGDSIMTILTVLGGAVGGKLIDKLAAGKMNPEMLQGLKIGGALLLPKLSSTASHKQVLKSLADGLLVQSGLQLMSDVGFMQGLESAIAGTEEEDVYKVKFNGKEISLLDIPDAEDTHHHASGSVENSMAGLGDSF